ncbi:MAG: hypothetical protein CLLPBCKN_000016 [Chroococcidiopsis cubana SAG 39.79]|uniref:Fungal lipase-type domain-containing protein n=1 Tax=Chroococcidiopsis cubana SAG 39.79 TaxID=388085 RepID=A0AB37UDZ3_9CYAN|nr:lipase [Chroococcidiopsis cubana]MDZ4870628.1 hypothetical protein [Chroococcidiopsis cubana SAG 39.79]PSB61114.1 lipase [Chroococcidiopsis cubana CCALA 043]RUT06874.1 hypothetical protein DSM107010_51930 [Chroococcidiopsis cubana SAG 39.79]
MISLNRKTIQFLTQAAFCAGLLSVSHPTHAQNTLSAANISSNVRSSQFEQLCFQRSVACEEIGKAAYMATGLIYQLFDAERVADKTKRQNAIAQINRLYGARQIDVVNKRLKLSDFFIVKRDKVFGGYAVLIRQPVRQRLGRKKVSYIVAFKGTYFGIDDPNDIIANVSGTPVNLYKKAAVLLHEGFKNYAASVFADPTSKKFVAEILSAQDRPNTEVEVLITGHSLGSASILYAALLEEAGVLPDNMRVISFGAPAFTQRNFQQRYSRLIANTTRVETEGDVLGYEKPGLLRPIYDSFSYLPLGNLVKTVAPQEYRDLLKQRELVEKEYQATQSQQARTTSLNLLKKIFAAQSNIHVYSYRYYHDYYLKSQGASFTRNGDR